MGSIIEPWSIAFSSLDKVGNQSRSQCPEAPAESIPEMVNDLNITRLVAYSRDFLTLVFAISG